MRAPMMLIHTVAAGGGSILHFDGARFRVGPDSAGANPGPKCYRLGGPLAVTDANVMVGKLMPEFFPHIFGPDQNQPLDVEAVRAAFAEIAQEIGDGRTPEQVADGFLQVAVANMASAIKKISVQRGYDVTRYALNCFGGAGGQHACLVADALGMTRVLIHPFSACSRIRHGLPTIGPDASARWIWRSSFADASSKPAAPRRRVPREVTVQGVREADIEIHVHAHVRYQGTDTALDIPAFVTRPGAAPEFEFSALKPAFEQAHRRRFGFVDASKAVVVEAVAVEAVGKAARHMATAAEADVKGEPRSEGRTRIFSNGTWHDTQVYRREAIAPGQGVKGPAVIIEPNQTIVVEDGWRATLTEHDNLVLERYVALPSRMAIGTDVDPIMLEIFNNLFMSIAEQMGTTLQNTAYSVNIKERLDFSCAVFDQEGRLVANAPHMPVHLGSMDRSVETVIRQNETIRPGDVFALNAPYNGGTHLPDITVCSPVFDEAGENILFWVASRGHHADVGGVAPGSMSPRATLIEEEGVYIDTQARRSGTLLRAGTDRGADRRPISRTQCRPERERPAGADRRQRNGHFGAARHDRPVRAGGGARLYGPCAGQCGRERAPGPGPARRLRLRIRNGPGLPHQGRNLRRQGEPQGHGRFHRHVRAARGQFQRAERSAGGGALCVQGDGGRQHHHERRLPGAHRVIILKARC